MLRVDYHAGRVVLEGSSLLSHLVCPLCGEVYEADAVQTICQVPACQSSLFGEYHLSFNLSTDLLEGRPANMWRYQEFLPVINPQHIVSLGEGFTPILALENLKKYAPENTITWKDESGNPTGSFKARGISTAISKAKELGIKDIVIPTAGNAGGALAAYAARAGINAHVFMPKLTPQLFKDEVRLYGASLIEVEGNISDCGRLAYGKAVQQGWFELSTLKEPYRLEGKKTMGYEIAEQSNWELPDVIFYPTGGGTGLIGIWKAFEELERLGWIGRKRPRMVAVQSSCCDGIAKAFHLHQASATYQDAGFTIANGLRVPKPYADKIILNVLYESSGTAISITDEEMIAAVKEIARQEGLLVAPEGAALWQAFKKLKAQKWIQPGEKVLLLNTGSGYKYLENVTSLK